MRMSRLLVACFAWESMRRTARPPSHVFTRIGWPGSGRQFSWQASIFTIFDTLLFPDIANILVSNLAIPSENRRSYIREVSTLLQCGQRYQSTLRAACQGVTLVGGCVETLKPTCSFLRVTAEPLPGLEPELRIDEVIRT
jgi:hypothetical protein